MMQRLYTAFALLFLVFSCTVPAVSQPLRVDFRQAANNDSPYTQGEVHWIQAILQQNNAVYYEGMSVPQRIVLSNIPVTSGNTHSLTFSHKATKNGKHAYDFLTSYEQAVKASNAIVGPTILYELNECGQSIGPPKSMAQTCVDIRGSANVYPVRIPVEMGTVLSHSVKNRVLAYESRFGDREIMLYGDKRITAASLSFDGYSGNNDLTAEYTLTWTSASSDILIEMAGHLAMGSDVTGVSGIGYGSGLGAGGISGASYHFSLGKLDGNALGSQDNQIKGTTVLTSISCSSSGPDVVCANTQNTYSFNSNLSGLSYTWSLSDNTSGASIIGSLTGSSVTVDAGNSDGEYTITVIVRDGLQTVSCPTYVTVNGFDVAAVPQPILCAGNRTPVVVTATGGAAPYSGTGTFLKHAGTHTFSVTDANGCSSTATVTILEPSQLLAQASASQVLCNSSTAEVTVSAIGGKPPYKGTGKFNRGVGTHNFSVYDANNCMSLATVTVAAPPAINVSATVTSQIDCYGGSATVEVSAFGGTPPYAGTGTFSKTAGTHTFTVTDGNGCTESATITITQPSAALAVSTTVNSGIDCYGGTATVAVSASGGTPPLSGTGTYSKSAGTHTFTVTDANGCSASTSVTLTEPASALSVSAAITSQINCFGGTGTVNVTASGGTPPYTGTGTFSKTAGTHTFTVTDANGCTASTSVTLTEPASAVSISAVVASQISCYGGDATIDVTASGGTPPYTGTGTFNRAAGTHTFTVTDANGCTASSSVILTQPSAALAASAAITSQINCYGGTGTVSVAATGGTPPYSGTGTFSKTAGTHTFTVTDANGCTTSAIVTLTEPASAINVSAAITSQISCHGGTGTVNVTASGGTPPYTGTGTFSKTAGTHTFTVTDANGCVASASVTLTEPASSITVSAAITSQISCYGGSGTVNVTATGGTPPYTGTGTFTKSAGTYTFTVTDANGCTGSATATLAQPSAALAASAAITSQINCYGGTGTVTVSATGGTAPYTGTGTFSKSAGTYTFTVTDANGCATSVSVTLTQPASSVNISAAIASQIDCYGGTGTVTVTASGGTPPYTGTGTFAKAAGTHTFTVTDANGCAASTSVTLSQPASALSVAASATPILCNGGTSTVTVSASGGTAPYTGTGIVTRGPGTHTFTVTDANGCSASASVTISEPPVLAVGITAPQILCNGGSSGITVTASGGTPPYSGTGTFSRGAGTHTFVVTDANGCSNSTSVTLTEPPLLTAAASATQILCNGNNATVTVTASGGTPPYNGTGTFSKGAGAHTLTVTDANGCTATTTVTITQPPALTVNANATPIFCNGNNSTVTVTASGGTPPYNGEGVFSVGAGTYTYSVTDANGCTATATVNISQPGQLTATISAPPILCYAGSTTITVNATGGTAPYSGTGTFTAGTGTYTYIVTDINGCADTVSITLVGPPVLDVASTATPILCNGGSSTVRISATGGTPPYTGDGTFTKGAGTHTFTVVDANGCQATTSVTITEPPLLAISASGPPVSCGKDSSTVVVTASGGTPPYTGTGSFTRGLGTHSFTVTDDNGCTVTTQVTITGPPPLYAGANATPILCYGGTTTISVTAWGGTAPYSGVGTFIRGAGTHTFVITDANNCTDTVEVSVFEPPALVVTADANPIACNGGKTTINVNASGGTPPYTGTGSFNRGAGTHTFVVTDANGCSDSVSITLIDPPPLSAAASATPILCNGDYSTVTVTATGGTAPYTGTGTFLKPAGTHVFVVTDARGCTATATVTITEPPELQALANMPTVLCGRDSAVINVTAMGGTKPYTGTGSFSRTPGTYTFIVTDANGCADTVQATVAGPPALYASVGATPILCHGGTSTVTVTAYGGTPPYSGVGTFTYGAGTHTFIVTDANQCQDSVTITIIEPPPLDVICHVSECINGMRTVSATVNGGTPMYSYLWMPFNSPTPTIDIPCTFSGTITLRVRDANWSSNDPNNAACEAYCSVQIFSKSVAEDGEASAPTGNDYALYQNYPNPFNPSTTIRYYVPEASMVRLSIINTLGRTITTLVDEEVTAGVHSATWNATAGFGTPIPSGSYIYRIQAKSLLSDREFVRERLMLLLR
jgi:hypothetical protein